MFGGFARTLVKRGRRPPGGGDHIGRQLEDQRRIKRGRKRGRGERRRKKRRKSRKRKEKEGEKRGLNFIVFYFCLVL